MNSEASETCAPREPDGEPLVIKKETDEQSDEIHGVALSRIKTEPIEDHWSESDVDNKAAIQLKGENKSTMNTDHEEFQAAGVIEQLFIKNENNQNTEVMSVLNSIKNEPDEVEWDDCEADKINTLDMKFENNGSEMEMDSEVNKSETVSSRIKHEDDHLDGCAAVKSEADMDSEEFKVSEITEECTIKSGSETSMDGTLDMASTSMAKSKFPRNQHQVVSKKAGRNSFCCYNCNHTVYSKRHLINHLKMHSKTSTCKTTIEDDSLKHMLSLSETAETASGSELSTCIHCDVTFETKMALDYHVVKQHPNFITSVTKKTYECTKCVYKTIFKHLFDRHMLTHPETASSYKPIMCIHCNATFKYKIWLDEHVVRKHPYFITSVASKLYKCTQCTYKTVIERSFNEHLSMHSETASTYKLNPCIHCNATFKSKDSLIDHVLKKHPDFVSSITRKIYACTRCSFKTTRKNQFDRHMSVHSGTSSSRKLFTCIHCDATVKSRNALTDHVVRKHPNFTTSVTNKIYECTQCVYKTVKKHDIDKHLTTHSKTASSSNFSSCVHCNATFKNNKWLDAHIVKTHPDCIASLTRKIYECTTCAYKTIFKFKFDRHIFEHTETASSNKPNACVHCDATFKSKADLEEHEVKKHQNFTSLSRKIYECTQCIYKTTRKKTFVRHMSRHPEAASGCELNTCVHCNATLKSKRALDDHVVRKHPNLAASVGRKIFECTECRFRTVLKCSLAQHMLTHFKTYNL